MFTGERRQNKENGQPTSELVISAEAGMQNAKMEAPSSYRACLDSGFHRNDAAFDETPWRKMTWV